MSSQIILGLFDVTKIFVLNAILRNSDIEITKLGLHGNKLVSKLVFLKVLLSEILDLSSGFRHGLSDVLVLLESDYDRLIMEFQRGGICLLALTKLLVNTLIVSIEVS